MNRIKKPIYAIIVFLFILGSAAYTQNTSPFISDFRINEQGGNSIKYYTKTAINNNNISIIVWYDYREGTPNIYAQLLDSSGALIGGNIKVNSSEDENLYLNPDVSVNEDNQFLIVWADQRYGYAIYGQLIDENGDLAGDNFIINDANITSYQFQPAIASNGKEFIVVWGDARQGSKYDIFAQRLGKDGSKIGENFVVNSDSQTISKYAPDAAIDKNGSFIATWYSLQNGVYSSQAIVRNKINNFFAPQFVVSDSSYSDVYNYYPQTATADSGFVVVCYRPDNGQYDIIGQFVDSSGEKVDSNFVINDEENFYRYKPTIASDSSGNFVVTWYDYRDNFARLYAQKFINNNMSGTNFKVSEDELNNSKSYVSCAINDNDNFTAAWLDYQEPTEYSIYSRLIDSNEQPVYSSKRVDIDSLSSLESDPAITVMDNGSFIIAWTDYRNRNNQTFFQRYDAEGNPLGGNINSDNKRTEYVPKVAELKDGNFLLIWREYLRSTYNQYEVLGQKYYKTGEKLGDPFIISSIERRGDAYDPDISTNSSGEFVVTWQKRYGSNYYIAASKFDADVNIVKNSFLVTDDTTSYKLKPKTGIDSLGNFAITYYGYINNNYDIYLNRYDSLAQELDSAIVVNDDDNKATQYYPDISVNSSGDCIITWYDYRSTGGIYFQKYKNIGSKDSFEKVDSNIAVTDYYFPNCSPSVSIQNNGEFVISWSEWNGLTTGSFNNLKLRIYNSDLTPLTDVMNGTETQERDQINQALVIKDNKIYSVWQDNHEHGVGYDIWANVYDFSDLTTDAEDKLIDAPTRFELSQNYPNPFNPSTKIKYSIPIGVNGNSLIQLKVYDLLGREVATLVNGTKSPGNYEVNFNASSLASGIYFYRLQAGKFVQTKKMILLK